MDQPLSGIRVVDLTRILSGPFCTMLLADMILASDSSQLHAPLAAMVAQGRPRRSSKDLFFAVDLFD